MSYELQHPQVTTSKTQITSLNLLESPWLIMTKKSVWVNSEYTMINMMRSPGSALEKTSQGGLAYFLTFWVWKRLLLLFWSLKTSYLFFFWGGGGGGNNCDAIYFWVSTLIILNLKSAHCIWSNLGTQKHWPATRKEECSQHQFSQTLYSRGFSRLILCYDYQITNYDFQEEISRRWRLKWWHHIRRKDTILVWSWVQDFDCHISIVMNSYCKVATSTSVGVMPLPLIIIITENCCVARLFVFCSI